jgi:hypothetical protein
VVHKRATDSRTFQTSAAGFTPTPDPADRAARRLSLASAALILVGGYVHYCLYRNGYRFIPKIGVSFELQAGASAFLAAALLVPTRNPRPPTRLRRHSTLRQQLTRLGGIGLSAGTLAALGLAHTPKGLFQFRELGLQPAPQTLIAILAESLATLLLATAIVEQATVTRRLNIAIEVAAQPRSHTRNAA